VRVDHINQLAKEVMAKYTGGGRVPFVGLLNRATREYRRLNGNTLSFGMIKRELDKETARLRYAPKYVQLQLF
jgi:hypothetical protein